MLRLAISLISLLLLLWFSSAVYAQCPAGPVSLEEFTGFVSIKAQLRFEVTSMKVGNVSVTDLFRDPNSEQTGFSYFTPVDRRLTIKAGADLEELHKTLLVNDNEPLKVTLEDRHRAGLRNIPGLASGIYHLQCDITVSLPECDQRTRVVYTQVSELTRNRMQMEGETTARVEVDNLFYKLLSEKVEQYMKSLSAPRVGPCVDKIELEKFLGSKGTAGFESKGSETYQLKQGIKDFLDVMAVVMKNLAQDWTQYHLDVKIVGFADRNNVQKKPDLLTSNTGIDETIWRNTPNALEVYFDGCKDDRVGEKGPVYVELFSHTQGNPIKFQINNNCELGAVRAYVASAYLRSRFGTDNISYSYATGGKARQSVGKAERVNPADRRIDIQFTMKGARKGK